MASPEIQSRALRAQLRMMQRAYGAQETDCISPPSATFPVRPSHPSHTSGRSRIQPGREHRKLLTRSGTLS
jgi:hypothetical protein